MPLDSATRGQEIIFLWDSPKDERGNYTPYEQYIVIVKYGNPFATTSFEIQRAESLESVWGQVFEIDGHTPAGKGTGGYLTVDENGEELVPFKTYRITLAAQKNGGYYFSIWSQRALDGKRCGPVYYPGNTLGLAITTEVPNPQEPYIVSSVRSNFVSLDESVSIYGLTAEGVSTSNITSPSKSIGGGETKVILRGEHSPDFNYRAFIKSMPIGQTTFSAKSRITIRKVSPNNTPSRTIYYLFPLGDIAEYQTFEFPSEANSLEAVNGKIIDGLVLSPRDIANIPIYTYVTTEHLTEEMIPLRDFDIVVEAYDPATNFTSAGNKLFDGWETMSAGAITTTKVSEGDFKVVKNPNTPTATSELYGYDILEVRLEPPSSLIMLDEYNDNTFVTTKEDAYDLEIPYLLEPKITNDGDLMVKFKTSEKGGNTYLNAVDIFNTYFQDIRGLVLYYADEPFVLANEQIKIPEDNDENREDTKQIFTVTNDDGSKSTMEVERTFWLKKKIEINPKLSTVSVKFPYFQNKNIKSSNIVIGFFDTLLHHKHFDVNDTARQLASRGNIKTIYGEKNLNFSRVAVPTDKFSGDPRVGGTKNTFNPETIYNEDGTVEVPGDLTLNSASIAIYRESLKDEDASTAFCDISVKANGDVQQILDLKNVTDVKFRKEYPKGSGENRNKGIIRQVNLKIRIELEGQFSRTPNLSYSEKDPSDGLYTECGTPGYQCTNTRKHITVGYDSENPYTAYEFSIQAYSTELGSVDAELKDFEMKVDFSS